MDKDCLSIVVKDGQVSTRTGGGGGNAKGNLDLGSTGSRRKLVDLFERWLREGKINKRDELEALGTLLYEMIFPTAINTGFLKKLSEFDAKRAADPSMKQRRLRVELEISQPDLAGLPWEFLFRPDTESAKGFFLSSRTALVLSRFIPLGTDRPELAACEQLKVLTVEMPSLAGQPLPNVFEDLEKLLEEQKKQDAKPGGEPPPRVAFERLSLPSPTIEEFEAALRDFQPHVLHYIGQGSGEALEKNCIGLRGDDDSVRWLSHNEFADLFQEYQPQVVLLHLTQSPESVQANFSDLAPELIRMNIKAVVALRYPFTLEVARSFTKQLYQSLLNCETVAAAVQEGRRALSVGGKHSSFGSPVLFLQSMDGPIAALPAKSAATSAGPAQAYSTGPITRPSAPGGGFQPGGAAPGSGDIGSHRRPNVEQTGDEFKRRPDGFDPGGTGSKQL